MNKKLIGFLLILLFAILLIGCNGVPKTAQLKVSFEPNPAPYDYGIDGWPFTITVSEQNGVGVALTEFTFKTYNNNNQLISTDVFGTDIFINEWFDTDYLSAFSSLEHDMYRNNNMSGISYAIITVDGVDDNNVPVTTEARIDFLPFL
jgi:hypothetical protein